MKVLYLIDTLGVGGAEKSILEIAANFKDFEPVVCHVFSVKDLKPLFEKRGIRVISLDLPKSLSNNKIVPKLLEVIEKEKPDIIHASLYRSMMISRKLKRLVNLPLVNSFVSDSYSSSRYSRLKFKTKLKLQYYQALDKMSVKIADLFISNSKAIADSNSEALKIPTSKIKVIHRGRDFKKYSNVSEELIKSLKSELNLNGNKVILNVGRLMESKGQADLIRAFKNVLILHPDAILLIAGEGLFRPKLEELIKKLELTNKVHLLGNREDVEVLLGASDLFVFTSYFEGLPGVILEAMIAEKIIIAGDIPENRECVDNNSAIFFPVGNIEILTQKIEEVFNNYNKYLPLAKKAKEIAAEKFDILMISSTYEDTYKQLLEKK